MLGVTSVPTTTSATRCSKVGAESTQFDSWLTDHAPSFCMLGFLSQDLTYSCAIFSELDADIKRPETTFEDEFWMPAGEKYDSSVSVPSSPTSAPPKYVSDDLYSAQMRKVRHIISKAKIKPGHRVLEIGSGWGTTVINIALLVPDTQVDSLTISVAQRDLAMERVRKFGLEDRVRIHLMDYRSMPESWKGSFDRLISIEMMEAIGREYMDTFWEKMNWAMNPKSAVGVVQCITLPEARTFSQCPDISRLVHHIVVRCGCVLQKCRFHTKMGLCSSMFLTSRSSS